MTAPLLLYVKCRQARVMTILVFNLLPLPYIASCHTTESVTVVVHASHVTQKQVHQDKCLTYDKRPVNSGTWPWRHIHPDLVLQGPAIV